LIRNVFFWRKDYAKQSNQALTTGILNEGDEFKIKKATKTFWSVFSREYPIPEQMQQHQLIQLVTEQLGASFNLDQHWQQVIESMNYKGSTNHIKYWALLKIARQQGVRLPRMLFYPVRNYGYSGLQGLILVDGESLLDFPLHIDPVQFDYNFR